MTAVTGICSFRRTGLLVRTSQSRTAGSGDLRLLDVMLALSMNTTELHSLPARFMRAQYKHAIFAPQPFGPILRPCQKHIRRGGAKGDLPGYAALCADRAHATRWRGSISRGSKPIFLPNTLSSISRVSYIPKANVAGSD